MNVDYSESQKATMSAYAEHLIAERNANGGKRPETNSRKTLTLWSAVCNSFRRPGEATDAFRATYPDLCKDDD